MCEPLIEISGVNLLNERKIESKNDNIVGVMLCYLGQFHPNFTMSCNVYWQEFFQITKATFGFNEKSQAATA